MVQRLRSVADDGPVITMERPDDGETRDALPPPSWGPPVAVDEIYAPDLLYNRERVAAVVRADLFASRLVLLTQAEGVPLDESLPHIEYWRAYVEVFGVLYLRWPYLFPEPPRAEDELEEWRPRDADDAAAMGLTVAAMPRRRERIRATLPGCQGPMSDGSACVNLRRFGEKYCPAHRAIVLRQMREGRA